MNNLNLKQKIIGVVAVVGALLILLFNRGISKSKPEPILPPQPQQVVNSDRVTVVSTNPSPLEGVTILPTQQLQITFSDPMVNDEKRIVLEPETKHEKIFSEDHKTLTIKPLEPYKLSTGYSLSIKSDYQSDNGKRVKEDIIFNFKTINYTGI